MSKAMRYRSQEQIGPAGSAVVSRSSAFFKLSNLSLGRKSVSVALRSACDCISIGDSLSIIETSPGD